MFDEKLTSRVFRLYSHKLHKQRLNEIKSKISTRINNSVPRTLKYQQIKRVGYVSQAKERRSNINRENEKIFQMISQISEGKRGSSIQFIVETTRQSPKPKSLNLPTRKKEAQRIIEDNYALAKRLSESTRGVSFKKFDEDWQHTTRYMDSISKKNIRKLPKIDELQKYMPSFASSEIGSKGVLMKTPGSDQMKSNFTPSLVSPLPGSVIEVDGEEEKERGKEEKGNRIKEGVLRKEIRKESERKGREGEKRVSADGKDFKRENKGLSEKIGEGIKEIDKNCDMEEKKEVGLEDKHVNGDTKEIKKKDDIENRRVKQDIKDLEKEEHLENKHVKKDVKEIENEKHLKDEHAVDNIKEINKEELLEQKHVEDNKEIVNEVNLEEKHEIYGESEDNQEDIESHEKEIENQEKNDETEYVSPAVAKSEDPNEIAPDSPSNEESNS